MKQQPCRWMSERRRGRRRAAWAWVAVAVTVLAAACGGGGGGDDLPRYAKVVVFGDSLSDVGSYATPGLVAATGGKRYTVNGAGAQIWVERLAIAAGVDAPCAAQTGLQSSGPLVAFAAPVEDHVGCFGYAQGGSRVRDQPGLKNQQWLAQGDPDAALGQLTVPVVEQMSRHLAASGATYDPRDLVTVAAGANDVFVQLALSGVAIKSGVNATEVAKTTAGALSALGAALASEIKAKVVDKGAKQVVVLNVPDISVTPSGLALSAPERLLLSSYVQAFNAKLAEGLSGVDEVLLVDAYARSQAHSATPQAFGFTDVTHVACDVTLAKIGSLGCSASTLVNGDVSHYAFADGVHPTPYGHQVWADFVIEQVRQKGWL